MQPAATAYRVVSRAQAYDEITSTLVIKFAFRPKPKHFALDSAASCRAVCQLLGRLLEAIDSGGADGPFGPGGASAGPSFVGTRPPPVSVGLDGPEWPHSFGGPPGVAKTPSTPTTPPPPPPQWFLDMLDRAHSRDWGEAAYAKVRSGWCCKKMVLEATLFGVLMPLALAGYWLTDAEGLGAETGKVDAKGVERWLSAQCELSNLLIIPRQVYHHGKFADAKDVAYQEGRIWRLEPAYNASVTLTRTAYGEDHETFQNWPAHWWAAIQSTATVTQRPHCDGQVLQTSEEVRRDCDDLSEWIPRHFLRLIKKGVQDVRACPPHCHAPFPVHAPPRAHACIPSMAKRKRALYAEHRGLARVCASQCWVDRSDRSLVFLDVQEPFSFYFDIFLIGFMLTIALAFAVCIVAQHRQALARAFRTVRASVFPPPAEAAPTAACGTNGRTPEKQPALLTPGSMKSAYMNVVKGFTEMV